MITIKGQSISSEIAIGTIRFFHNTPVKIQNITISDIDSEITRYQSAHEKAQKELQLLYEKTLSNLSKEEADIFDMHIMLMNDSQFHQAIMTFIKEEHKNAEYAVNKIGQTLSEQFFQMPDAYLQARGSDILDISNRLLRTLSGQTDSIQNQENPCILMADDLTPSQTIQLDSSKLLGFVTRHGSPYSHTAILAKTMQVPALQQVDIEQDWDGHTAILDGEKQCLYLDPEENMIKEYKAKQQHRLEERKQLLTLIGKPAITGSGQKIQLLANINHPMDISSALEQDAQGIGLFRSEFLYLGAHHYPDENAQFAVYKHVVKQMQGKNVVIRTLDLGADKQAPYMGLLPEENPALGYRAIRICLSKPALFKTQIRAILRASAYGNVQVMFPMISSLWEVQKAKELLEECKRELSAESIPYGDMEIGVMIETPAAVMIADELAKEVDFFSIGTNDLTQYTLAIDRNNAALHAFYDPHHPAVLKMIQMTIEAGHRHNCKICICGELGSDLELTETFLNMGIDALSVAPNSILPLKKVIREL